MNRIFLWITSNKEWLFSGVGLVLVTVVVSQFYPANQSSPDGASLSDIPVVVKELEQGRREERAVSSEQYKLLYDLFEKSLKNSDANVQQSTYSSLTSNLNLTPIFTGSKYGTYIRFGKDIEKYLKKKGVLIRVNEGTSSVNNMLELLVSSSVTRFAIVQSDVLEMLENPYLESKHDSIQLVQPLYTEEVHVLVNSTSMINNITQLSGKRVFAGYRNSGNWLSAHTLFRLAQVNHLQFVEGTFSSGLEMLAEGSVDAVYFIVGKPMTALQNGNQKLISKFRLLSIPLTPELSKYYHAATFSPMEYNWMTASVDTVAVKALLISSRYKGNDSVHAADFCRLLDDMSDAISLIREEAHSRGGEVHPKWRDVSPQKGFGGWSVASCLP